MFNTGATVHASDDNKTTLCGYVPQSGWPHDTMNRLTPSAAPNGLNCQKCADVLKARELKK